MFHLIYSLTSLWCLPCSNSLSNLFLTYCFSVSRSTIKRSYSDGNILRPNSSPMSAPSVKQETNYPVLPNHTKQSKILSESSPEISTCESDIAYSRFANDHCSSVHYYPFLAWQLVMTEQNNIWSLYCFLSREEIFFREHMIVTRKSKEGSIKRRHSFWKIYCTR